MCVCVCGHQTSSSVTSLLGKGYEGSDARSGQPAAVTEALLCVSIHPSINQSVAHSMRSQVTGALSFITPASTCLLSWNTGSCLYRITLPFPACTNISSRTPEGAVQNVMEPPDFILVCNAHFSQSNKFPRDIIPSHPTLFLLEYHISMRNVTLRK